MTKEYPKTSHLNLLEQYGWQPKIAQARFELEMNNGFPQWGILS